MEIWKDINGFNGLYKVSNMGNVISYCHAKQKGKKPIVLKQAKSNTGYYHVQLYKDGKAYTVNIHKLVAIAFVDNPKNLTEINHIDGNKSNNTAINLEWVTRRDNTLHAIKNGLRLPSPMIGKKGIKSPMSKTILQYDLDGNFMKIWYGISEAARSLNCPYSCISLCILGKNKTGAGYIWKELNDDYIPMTIDTSMIEHTPNGIYYNEVHVTQFTIDGKPIKKWNSLSSASQNTGCSAYKIKKCCQGAMESVNGFKWKYA